MKVSGAAYAAENVRWAVTGASLGFAFIVEHRAKHINTLQIKMQVF